MAISCAASGSCSGAQISCPSDRESACNITCGSTEGSCYGMDIYADNDFVNDFLSLDCGSLGVECTDTTLNCQENPSSGSTLKSAVSVVPGSASDGDWQCEHESTSYCCPWLEMGPATCSGTGPCDITCSELVLCRGLVVNGSSASSLSIECGEEECNAAMIVICPSGACSIDCAGRYGCTNMRVWASNTSTLTVNCGRYESCDGMEIQAQNVDSISLTCSQLEHEEYSANTACTSMKIYAQNAGYVALSAWSDGECVHIQQIQMQ